MIIKELTKDNIGEPIKLFEVVKIEKKAANDEPQYTKDTNDDWYDQFINERGDTATSSSSSGNMSGVGTRTTSIIKTSSSSSNTSCNDKKLKNIIMVIVTIIVIIVAILGGIYIAKKSGMLEQLQGCNTIYNDEQLFGSILDEALLLENFDANNESIYLGDNHVADNEIKVPRRL